MRANQARYRRAGAGSGAGGGERGQHRHVPADRRQRPPADRRGAPAAGRARPQQPAQCRHPARAGVAGIALVGGVYWMLLREIRRRGRAERIGSEANQRLLQSVAQLERHSADLNELTRYGSLLQNCLGPTEALELEAQTLSRLLPDTGGSVYRIRASRDYAEAVVHWGEHAAAGAVLGAAPRPAAPVAGSHAEPVLRPHRTAGGQRRVQQRLHSVGRAGHPAGVCLCVLAGPGLPVAAGMLQAAAEQLSMAAQPFAAGKPAHPVHPRPAHRPVQPPLSGRIADPRTGQLRTPWRSVEPDDAGPGPLHGVQRPARPRCWRRAAGRVRPAVAGARAGRGHPLPLWRRGIHPDPVRGQGGGGIAVRGWAKKCASCTSITWARSCRR